MILINDFSSDIRMEAVNKITDKSLLASIAKNGKAVDIQEYAVANINDEKMLLDIANNAKDITGSINSKAVKN